ncbi:MAG TPA: site-2 protease family protein [Longimicrobiaceae bacterium]|nr:site-2 protease family protein [Longimicrobiaceae bacterium]
MSLFAVYRIVVIREDEIVQGVLHPGLRPEDPEVRSALAEWGGTHFLHQTPDGVHLTLVRPLRPRRRERWWLHVALALLSLLTTTIAGAYFAGREPLASIPLAVGAWQILVPVWPRIGELVPGLRFSVPLMVILLGHELGHYLVARRLKIDASPPYFIPAPNFLNIIGTFGAFIRLRSALVNRVMLLDVGAAGPLVSFVLSIPAVLLGLHWSTPLGPVPWAGSRFVAVYAGEPLWLGSSPLFQWASELVGRGHGVLRLDPLAVAGWIGLFVTALNLFPLSQLDGGHVVYALFERLQRPVAWLFLLVLLALGNPQWGGWMGWWFWLGLILLLGRASVAHPPVFDPGTPVSGWRRGVGWACIIIFFLTFSIVPFRL